MWAEWRNIRQDHNANTGCCNPVRKAIVACIRIGWYLFVSLTPSARLGLLLINLLHSWLRSPSRGWLTSIDILLIWLDSAAIQASRIQVACGPQWVSDSGGLCDVLRGCIYVQVAHCRQEGTWGDATDVSPAFGPHCLICRYWNPT